MCPTMADVNTYLPGRGKVAFSEQYGMFHPTVRPENLHLGVQEQLEIFLTRALPRFQYLVAAGFQLHDFLQISPGHKTRQINYALN